MGDELDYENKLERSFVLKKNEDSVRDDLINTFKSNSLDYLASVNFPQKMALSILKDINKNPYKYHPHIYSDPEE
jgi:flagellar basal body-associated protein FliL